MAINKHSTQKVYKQLAGCLGFELFASRQYPFAFGIQWEYMKHTDSVINDLRAIIHAYSFFICCKGLIVLPYSAVNL